MQYLLTGATGVVGSTLVPELLEYTDARLRLLIRARDGEHLAERLESLHAFWGHGPDHPVRERIEAVAGDITLPRLGLTDEEWQRSVSETTHVVHAAAWLKFTLPLADALRSSRDATASVLELCRAARENGQFEKLEHVSTVGVNGRRKQPLPEGQVVEEREFHNSYEAGKARAEDLVHQAMADGLPATVHRPSLVTGDSRTGRVIHYQLFYHICEFLTGARTRGLLPDVGPVPVDLVPVDHVARAIRYSSMHPECTGKVLHLCSGAEHAVPLPRLIEVVRATLPATNGGHPRLRWIPLWTLRLALPVLHMLAPARLGRALHALPVMFAYADGMAPFETARTTEILAAGDIRLPAPDEYLETVLGYYVQHGRR